MNNTRPVCFVEPVHNLNPVFERRVEWQRAFLQPLGQRLAFDVLHNEVIDTVLLAYVIKRADVRMVELRNRLRLAFEACLAFGALGEMLGEDLDGDGPVEAGVVGFVNLAHSSLADWREDFVRA